MLYAKLRQEGFGVNVKVVERLYAEERLTLHRRSRKKIPNSMKVGGSNLHNGSVMGAGVSATPATNSAQLMVLILFHRTTLTEDMCVHDLILTGAVLTPMKNPYQPFYTSSYGSPYTYKYRFFFELTCPEATL